MGSTVALTLRSSIIAALGVSGTAGAQDAANSAAPNVEEIVVTGSSLARCGTRRLESRHRWAGRHREHRRADGSADPEDRAVRRRVAERRAGRVRQLRRRRHQCADDSRPRGIGVEQHADPPERSPHAGLRHQPRARRSEHRRAARARARRGARRRRFVGLRLRCRRGRRQFHYAAQRRRSRSVAADRRGATPTGPSTRACSAERLGTAARCSSPTTIPIATTSKPSTATTCARTKRRAAAGTSRRTAAAPRASLSGRQTYLHAVHGARASSPAIAIRRCTRISRAARLRHSVFATIQQDVSDRLTLTGDLIYSERENDQVVPRGNASATMFGPGAANAGASQSVLPCCRRASRRARRPIAVNFSADALARSRRSHQERRRDGLRAFRRRLRAQR